MHVRVRWALALFGIAVAASGARALGHPAALRMPLAAHPATSQAGQPARAQPHDAAPLRPLSLPLPVTPSLPLPRTEPRASALPELTNPLRRRRMAMPAAPSGDYAF